MAKASVNKASVSTGVVKPRRVRTPSIDAGAMTINTKDLPVAAQNAIAEVLRIVANGGTPLVTGDKEFLTTSEAANILNVTRPTIISWIDEGRLSSHLVGTHRRLSTSEVHELRTQIRKRQLAAIELLINS
jgi:excisionase family DNA binding protein